jgi:hypothetical protein
MSEEFCGGVKILLKRMESNPEEFRGQDNKWSAMIPKGSGGYIDWNHALTEEELKALAEGMRKIYRSVYTEKVMSTLLYETEEEPLRYSATERYAHGMTDPRMLVSLGGTGGGGTGMLGSPYQNTIQAGSWQTVATQPGKLSLGEILKQKLANL